MTGIAGKRRTTVLVALTLLWLLTVIAMVRHVLENSWIDVLIAAGGVVLLFPTPGNVSWMAADFRENTNVALPWQNWCGLSLIVAGLVIGLFSLLVS